MPKTTIILALISLLAITACTDVEKTVEPMNTHTNILLKNYDTPYGVPPFDKIDVSDYAPAYEIGIAEKRADIAAIVNNTEEATFENTIEALEYSGVSLKKVSYVFSNLKSSNNDSTMEAIAEEYYPLVTALSDEISMNPDLFKRVKHVFENTDKTKLTTEQNMLLEKTYKGFVRGGANLNAEDNAKLKEINKELGLLTLSFGTNVLKETNAFKVVIDNEKDLKGLPQSVLDAAAITANANGEDGKWMFTIQKSSLIPVLSYSEDRELRKKMYLGYTNKGNHNNEFDNKANVAKMVNLRLQKANLLGYNNWAEYILVENIAKTPERAYSLVSDVITKSLVRANEELVDLQKIADAENAGIKIEAWDWWFYTEKLRKERFDLSEEELKPYFALENVRDGMFDVATKLFDLEFKVNTEVPKMDPLADAYEVYRKGELIAIMYLDYYPRESKRGGAWMTSYRKQSRTKTGENVLPIISLTCNFTPATADAPSLLNLDEVTTLFHEFGHGLHGLLSTCQYETLSGTAVARDFVELPSQIMENWALQPEVLKSYAKHYKTGEVMPDELIAKMQNAGTFNNGFVVSEFAAAAALDMAWHKIETPFEGDVNEFEAKTMTDLGLMSEIAVRYRSTYYTHIFAGGYAAGYYAYLWTAVLDADAFGAFQETSLFDKPTADLLYNEILSAGGSDDVEKMWLRFRGRQPEVSFYLERQGL